MNDSHEFDLKNKNDTSIVDDKDQSDMIINPFINVSNIDPNAIPKIPYPKFLSRDNRNEIDDNNKKYSVDMVAKEKQPLVKHSNYYITNNGKKIRGRGAMRYDRRYSDNDQNNRDIERSTTPPHWRYEQSKLIKLSQVELKLLEPKNFLKAFETNSSKQNVNLKVTNSHNESNKLKHSVESRILKIDRSNYRDQHQSNIESKWVRNSKSTFQFESSPRSGNYRNHRYRYERHYRSRSRDRYHRRQQSENKFKNRDISLICSG